MLGLLLSGYSIWASWLSISTNRLSWQLSSHRAIVVSCVSIVSASFILWFLLWQRDYSVAYIAKNSSADLPAFYTITAFWSSLEGSHLFWSLILAIICVICIHQIPHQLRALGAYIHLFLSAVMVWMYLLLVSYSDPFAMQLPAPTRGAGMNALLQNPYMAIHPPLLFLGYTTLVVPYVYSMAALCYGTVGAGWIRLMRQWSLVAWMFLTVGIALGGRWAYVELGWGGYWAWDPVENSSFIPWLLTTALLHGCALQHKMGRLVKVNIALSILAFFFSFFGTFLTRSGIVVSVHSFAQSDIGKVYVVFLAVLFGLSLIIYLLRKDQLIISHGDRKEVSWRLSRELMMVGGIFLLVVLAAVVSLGTLYPIVSEMISGVKVNVQAPYFNTFAPWFGAALAGLMAFGALLRYHSSRIWLRPKSLVVMTLVSGVCALMFAGVSGVYDSGGFRFAIQLVGTTLVFFTASCQLVDLVQRARPFGRSLKESEDGGVSALRLFVSRNLTYLGGAVAHGGFLLALLGFLGNYSGMETTLKMAEGQRVSFAGYTFEYLGLDQIQQDNATLMRAVVSVRSHNDPSSLMDILTPARSQYPTKKELLHEVDIHSRLWQDLYLVLADLPRTEGGPVAVKVYINPLVKLVWLSVVLMLLGAVMAFFGRLRMKS